MKNLSNVLVAIGLLLIFSVLGIDIDQQGAAATALGFLAVGYLVAAAGIAISMAHDSTSPLSEMEVF
ncbi:hypothetical protein [Marinobacter sp. F3R08]|uniref:hypothetical protein n=1 Tax=Marinobacter sp. F3R08 TaxID=2841559 RepID=UPI001C086465|nr:hypothetical protein [Marinobacter sp. F3R08]MBU2952275.1 hypothetical protein [Marinobacter sp. F3R08]